MAARSLPVRASVRDLLTDLLGRPVQVRDAAMQVLDPAAPSLAASYVLDDGRPAAVAVCDLSLAGLAGAALGMTPSDDAAAQIATGKLGGDFEEFFREVVNVIAKLFNSPSSPHVRLAEVRPVPGPLPAPVAAIVLEPGARVDYRIDIDGYGSGTMTLVA